MNSSYRHVAAVLALCVAFVAALTFGLLGLALPQPPPPELPTPAPLGPPLTRHLMLVVIDGLRQDIATDAAKMPHLAARLQAHASGVVWANPVSMTSSAVLTYGTGQRGDIDQVVNNETGSPTAYDHLPAAVRDAGLTTAGTGDHAWFQMYPGAWDREHPDPEGVGMEVDYNAEIFAAAREMLAEPRPALHVVHFVTPDHQGHVHGPLSERYAEHIRGFDADLDAFLRELPADTTVFVTSDHGAGANGEHGSDTPEQRRSPIVAWGPGIVPELRGAELHQIDLPSTFAALLGVRAPAHARGHVRTEWLDAPDEARAALACADLARLQAYTGALVGPEAAADAAGQECTTGTARERIAGAPSRARALDQKIQESTIKGSTSGWLLPVLAVLGALLVLALVLSPYRWPSRHRLGASALVAGLVAFAAWLNWQIELLPGGWHQRVYIILAVVAYLTLIAGLAVHRRAVALLDRHAVLGAALLPGLLVVSYTRSTQPHSFIVAALVIVVALVAGIPRAAAPLLAAPRRWAARWPDLLTVAVVVGLFWRVGFKGENYIPPDLVRNTGAMLAVAVGAIAVFALLRHVRDPRATLLGTLAAAALAAGSLALRPVAPTAVCLLLWAAPLAGGVVALARRHRSLGELLILAGYAQVARDPEIPLLLGWYLAADAVGRAMAAGIARDPEPGRVRPSMVLFVVTFLFTWTWLGRIAVQLGLDFTHMDFAAGAFRQPDTSLFRVALALFTKYAVARGAVIFAVLAPLAAGWRPWVVRGLLAAELVRSATLATMLFVSRWSFWTSLRLIGDIPHALVAVVVAAIALALVSRPERAAQPRVVPVRAAA